MVLLLCYFQYLHYNFNLTGNTLRKAEGHETTYRFRCYTVVFILNGLFVTVHVDDILNTEWQQ